MGGGGRVESLGLKDVNYYIQNRLTTRSYCTAWNYIQYPVIKHNGKE